MALDSHTITSDPEAADTSANLTIADSTENNQDPLPTACPLLVFSAFHCNLLNCFVL